MLTWVHVAEVSSFLKAHLRYVNPLLPLEAQDRYYAETSTIAEMLGATNVPKSCAEIDEYLASMQPQLEASERTREVLKVLMNAPTPSVAMKPASALILNAGVDLLPDWAQSMLGFGALATLRRVWTQPGVKMIAPLIRWALNNGVSKRARRRAAMKPDLL